jgi:tryptophan-rich sensory protein
METQTYTWYQTLVKPTWAPPAWVFGPVWSVLYAIIAVSFGYVAFLFFKGKVPFVVFLPFLLNVLFNLAFTPIQFGLQNNVLAAIDILFVVGTLVWALWIIFPITPWVTYVNLPYLAWGLFATVLQLTITYINW